jgi:hypothetical protein
MIGLDASTALSTVETMSECMFVPAALDYLNWCCTIESIEFRNRDEHQKWGTTLIPLESTISGDKWLFLCACVAQSGVCSGVRN